MPRSPTCQWRTPVRPRSHTLMKRETSEPPRVITMSGSISVRSASVISLRMRSMLPCRPGPCRLACASHSTATLGMAARRTMALLSLLSGLRNPATTRTLHGGARRCPNSRACAVGRTVGLSTTSIMRGFCDPTSASVVSGTSSCTLMCTGPLRPEEALRMASDTRRFTIHIWVASPVSTGMLYDSLTILSRAPYWRMVWLSSWSIHSCGRSAVTTIRGTSR